MLYGRHQRSRAAATLLLGYVLFGIGARTADLDRVGPVESMRIHVEALGDATCPAGHHPDACRVCQVLDARAIADGDSAAPVLPVTTTGTPPRRGPPLPQVRCLTDGAPRAPPRLG